MPMTWLLIDGNSIVNRAFYGVKPLTTKDGHFTNALVGFFNIFLRLKEMTEPDAVAVAFDLRAPTFRHALYEGYKAGRKGMPPELAEQMEPLKDLLRQMGVATVEKENYEADDILGTLAGAARARGDRCFIATGDRDSLQLIGGGVEVLLTATKMGHPEILRYDEAAVAEHYGGLKPLDLIQVKALMGDSSDKIPGVAGVGEKTAVSLIARFGDLDGVYASLDDPSVTPGLRAKLAADRENAYLSRTLGTICTEVPIDTDPECYRPRPMDRPALTAHLARLEMFKLIERLNLDPTAVSTEAPADLPRKIYRPAPAEALGKTVDLVLTEEGAVALSEGRIATLTAEEIPGFVQGRTLRVNDAKALYHLAPDAVVTFDSSLAAYLLNPSAGGYDVVRLIAAYGIPSVEADESLSAVAPFSLLCDRLTEEVKRVGAWDLLETMELPLARVLADMERIGFLVDREGILAFGDELQTRLDFIVGEIYELVGYEFNLNSPKQLGEALFVKLGLPAGKKTKSGYSTNAEVLEELRDKHPAVELLLEYRQLSKLRSTYCEGLVKAVAADGRIHSCLHQTETRTGRISSAEPNLQNIPVRTELGSKMRHFFRAPEGRVLCDADYSQIELRVLAHLSGDPAMIEAFRSGADIHTATAAQVFGLPANAVSPIMRSRAKAVNFGIVYGIGAFSLAKDIGVSFSEAKRYIEDYLDRYRGVADYMEKTVADAKKKGYVETAFGRRRYLPELTSSNHQVRAFGERVARNAPIQGTAADIIKIAMVRVWDRLRREGLDAHLILQIHDELIVEASEQDAEKAAEILSHEMEQAIAMQVPLPADVHIGKDWYEAKG